MIDGLSQKYLNEMYSSAGQIFMYGSTLFA